METVVRFRQWIGCEDYKYDIDGNTNGYSHQCHAERFPELRILHYILIRRQIEALGPDAHVARHSLDSLRQRRCDNMQDGHKTYDDQQGEHRIVYDGEPRPFFTCHKQCLLPLKHLVVKALCCHAV